MVILCSKARNLILLISLQEKNLVSPDLLFVDSLFYTSRSLAPSFDFSNPYVWLASIDLQDAYFHVPLHPSNQKYLRFHWIGVTFQFQILPFGLTSAFRVFIRVLAPIIASLRSQGVHLYAYLDDLLIIGNNPVQTLLNPDLVISVLTKAGYILISRNQI